jgi:hypothetical protein
VRLRFLQDAVLSNSEKLFRLVITDCTIYLYECWNPSVTFMRIMKIYFNCVPSEYTTTLSLVLAVRKELHSSIPIAQETEENFCVILEN